MTVKIDGTLGINKVQDGIITSNSLVDSIRLPGSPTAATASAGTSTDQIATTKFVTAADNNLQSQINVKAPIITTDTVLTVGANKQFPSIQAALDSLRGFTIASTVTIQVDDGIYTQNGEIYVGGFTLLRCSLRIIGNIANPAACVLQNTAAGWQNIVNFDRVRNVEFSGFRIVAKQTDSYNAQNGIIVGSNSRAYSADNSIILENVWRGVGVYGQSSARFAGIRITNHVEWAIVVGSQSEGDFYGAVVNGRGREVPLTIAAGGIFSDGVNCTSQGILATDEGMLWCRRASVSNCGQGFVADGNSTVWANASKADTCVIGFHGICGAKMISDSWPVTPSHPTLERSLANNCYTGFLAEWNGQVHADSASAQGCRDVGFAAYWGGVANAGNSIVNGSGLCLRADMNGTVNGWGNQQSGNTAYAWASGNAVITTLNA
ncbi:MAG: hypothetical protein JHC33_02370 [Ignisphaera sp.]|nr:hypothetical protein [Ignisphaera sp.]